MTSFEPYFEALDGPQPYGSLELVAPDVEFSIQWAPGADRKSSQFRGGLDELRGFIDAGDMAGWVHYVLWSSVDDDVEFARWERRVTTAVSAWGRFLRSPSSTTTAACGATWWRARRPSHSRSAPAMLGQRDFVPVAECLIPGAAAEPCSSARRARAATR
jgi:hypothetical protein